MIKNIGVIGLGYVGLPLLIEFAKYFKVFGIDISKKRIKDLKKGIDYNNLLEKKNKKLINKIFFSSNFSNIKKLNIIIVCLPTPVTAKNIPDLTLIKSCCVQIGKYLKKNSTIIFESTVYPGVTEEICVPIIEKVSKLKWKKDFFVGYSPERVSPGKNYTTLPNIKKIISADSSKSLKTVNELYSKIIKAGLHVAKSIKVAEAAKILENTQRDVNIALMNEISVIFKKLKIDTHEVIEAASSKWNFNTYYPGLVGGHCIGVDPYYLSHKSIAIGHQPDLILTSRKINEFMIFHIIDQLNQFLVKNTHKKEIKILILGVTYKENCNDLRNSKVIDLINELKNYNYKIVVSDLMTNSDEIYKLSKSKNTKFDKIKGKFDAILLCQPHDFYLKNQIKIKKLLVKNGVFFDLKKSTKFNKFKDLKYWSL